MSSVEVEAFLPGEFIRDALEARDWTQEDLARILGHPLRTVDRIFAGKDAVTPQTAQEPAAAFGTTLGLWMNLQSACRSMVGRVKTAANGMSIRSASMGRSMTAVHSRASGLHSPKVLSKDGRRNGTSRAPQPSRMCSATTRGLEKGAIRMLRVVSLVVLFVPLAAVAAERPLAPWPPPAGELRVVIDADAANEVDDQWAIATALGFPERLRIEGFVSAHYGVRGGSKGIAKSHASILAVLERAGRAKKYVVKQGSDPIVYRDRLPESEGVDFIIEQARKSTPEKPLWLVALGPATNAAVALLKDPSIADRIVVLWHGRTEWPKRCWNFNAYNDVKAVQVLFDAPVRLILFDTGEGLTMPMDESERRVGTLGELGEFLHGIRKKSAYASRADKGMFDLGDVTALIDEKCVAAEVTAVPAIDHDLRYAFDKRRAPDGLDLIPVPESQRGKDRFVRIHRVDRDLTFRLLDQSLKRIADGSE